jgi:hypothetical protein
MADGSAIRQFFSALWPELPAGLHLPIFTVPGERTRWCASADEAVTACQVDELNVYCGVAMQDRVAAISSNGERTRGTSATARAIAGLWVDVDFKGPSHAAENLAPTLGDALSVVGAMGLPASIITRTGGGVQAWWLFREPWELHEPVEWQRAAALAAGWVVTAQAHGGAKGWKVDSTKDLARVLRVPGTFNVKAEPVLVTADYFDHRYNPSDFDEHLYLHVPAERFSQSPELSDADEADLYVASCAVKCLNAERSDEYESWINVGMVLKSLGHEDATFELWDKFSARSDKYDAQAIRKKWDQLKPTGAIGLGSLLYWARQDSKNGVLGYDDAEIKSAFQRIPKASNGHPIVLGVSEKSPAPTLPPGVRPRIANVLDATIQSADGEEKNVVHYMPVETVAAGLSAATGQWPRRAGGVLFTLSQDYDRSRVPKHSDVTWLSKSDKLFAWMQKVANLRWTTKAAYDPVTKQPLTPCTKGEFFEYLIHYAHPAYVGLEVLPHEPPFPDLFYVPCELTQNCDDGGALDKLVQAFNAESEEDRQLLLAALMTPGWGGPAGSRPAFVFTSDHGRGVGKTVTAEVFAQVWGGAISISADGDWEKVRSRMLGDESLGKRCMLFDNIKHRLSGSDIESIITSKVIDGWKPFYGQASRPNLLTWYMTANTPSLSRDLADRSVVIKIGRQNHGRDFIRWAQEHITNHQAEIVGSLLALLRQPAGSQIERKNRDRWTAWQDGVLSKFPNADELAALIISRRPTVDSDLDDAEDVAGAVTELISETFPDYEQRKVFISKQQLHGRLMKKGLVGRDMSMRGVTTWVKNMAHSGPLHFLTEYRKSTERGWLFVGQSSDTSNDVNELPGLPDERYGWNRPSDR